MTPSTDTFSALADLSVAFAPPAASVIAGLSDAELLGEQRRAAELSRRVAALSAAYANEIAHRSRRELGHAGLAQRLGQRTAENLVQKVTGTSAPEARSLVQAGALLPVDVERADAAVPPSWLAAVGEAVASGGLSTQGASAIQTGLGGESEAVSAGDLAIAGATLLREAGALTVEQLASRARQLRNELDLAGIRDREAAQHEKRYLKFTKLPDGMTRVHGLLDTESAAIVVPIFDAVTSPRRGGPRFVDPDEVERAEALSRDARTTDQITLDAFVDLLRAGAAADPTKLLGSRKPNVHVLVTARDLEKREGFAAFPGQSQVVSVETAERHICATGMLPILFDDKGQPLKLGRTQRLYSEAQRTAIAARDGGCIFGDCEAPPSWSEFHHIDEWVRDGGETNVEDGVCLCRFHHLLLHNRGWRITRRDGEYWLTPPPTEDPEQRPVLLRSKSPVLRRLLATNG